MLLLIEAHHRRFQAVFKRADELQARLALSVVAPPYKGTKKRKRVRYEDLLLEPPDRSSDKTDEEKTAEYQDIVRHVRGREFKLGRGIKSSKTIREIAEEKRRNKREHRS